MMGKRSAKLPSLAGRLRRDRRGVAAVEFAIFGPLMILVLAGGTDLGLAVFKRMRINEAVSAAASVAVANGSLVSSATVDSTARAIAAALTRGAGGDRSRFQMTFNGGRIYDFAGSVGTSSGPTSAADECRCPKQVEGAVAWGGKVDCNTPCPNKSLAGRYVSIRFTQPYTPLFPQFGLVEEGGITVRTLALVQ